MGNLETKVTEELLFELFHQAELVVKVKIPRDKREQTKAVCICEFQT
jgi:RNA-binding protein 7